MISRVPQGQTAETTEATLLDYTLARPAIPDFADSADDQGLIATYIHWKYAPADHGWLVTSCRWRTRATRRLPKTWEPDDDAKARDAAACLFDNVESLADFESKLRDFQNKFKTRRTATQRRRERVPAQGRELYRQASQHNVPNHYREQLRRQAWAIIVNERRSELLRHNRKKLSAGILPKKPKATKNIDAMFLPKADNDADATRCDDPKLWSAAIRYFFVKKWICAEAEYIDHAMDNLDDIPCPWSPKDIQDAFDTLKHKKRRDTCGFSIHSLSMVPERVLRKLLTAWAHGDDTPMSKQPRGYVAGK